MPVCRRKPEKATLASTCLARNLDRHSSPPPPVGDVLSPVKHPARAFPERLTLQFYETGRTPVLSPDFRNFVRSSIGRVLSRVSLPARPPARCPALLPTPVIISILSAPSGDYPRVLGVPLHWNLCRTGPSRTPIPCRTMVWLRCRDRVVQLPRVIGHRDLTV